ncbi:MAG TPA: molecular chaperone TorD family protein, partial [bacterium]|nr:molecular chaperone TorD family protein [bacterium]
ASIAAVTGGHAGAPRAEVFRALAVLCEPPADGHARVCDALGLAAAPDAAEFTDLFVLHLYPYASVYLGAEGMLGGEARDRVAGFWRALHLTPPPEPDHLAALLGLYASLLEREGEEREPARRALWGQARAALLHEHLASWLPPYLDRIEALAPGSYRSWAELLRASLAEEAARAADAAAPPDGSPPAVALSAHLRAAPPLPDPRRDGSRAFVTGLLAPVRCGMILTRADFVRAAQDLGLGLRVGERKFALAALLSQAPEAVLDWLAGAARGCAARHAAHTDIMGAAAGFWSNRAAAAAHLLDDLGASETGAAAGDGGPRGPQV